MEVDGYEIEPRADRANTNLRREYLSVANLADANIFHTNLIGVILTDTPPDGRKSTDS